MATIKRRNVMKQTRKIIVWLVFFWVAVSSPVFGKPFAEGPYLGQTPPGPIAKVFAPGLICNTEKHPWEANGTFSADGNTFCFNRRSGVFITENTSQGWTTPKRIESIRESRLAPWLGGLSPDANSIFFTRALANAIYIAAFERQVDGPNHSNLDRHLALRPPNLPAL
jgi:hypothetical protein